MTSGPSWWRRYRAWLGRLYARVESYANTPAAFGALMVVSAVDSAFLPVPPFVLLIPMVVADPKRWLRLVLWGTFASVLGSLLGYGIGLAMQHGLQLIHVDLNVRLDIDRLGVHGTIAELLGQNWWSLAVVCMLAPAFKLATIGSGLVGVPIPAFLAACVVARLVRFAVAAGLARFGGPGVRSWLLRHAHAHSLQSPEPSAVET